MNAEYNTHDIENFLEISKEIEAKPENKSLQKLLSVKDKIDIFKDIDEFELKALVYHVEFKKIPIKKHIIQENEASKNIYFILKGECHVYKGSRHIGTLSEGDTFGEIGVIFNLKRSANVIAASNDVVVLKFCIDQENLDFNAKALAILYKNLAASINDKLQELNIAYIKK